MTRKSKRRTNTSGTLKSALREEIGRKRTRKASFRNQDISFVSSGNIQNECEARSGDYGANNVGNYDPWPSKVSFSQVGSNKESEKVVSKGGVDEDQNATRLANLKLSDPLNSSDEDLVLYQGRDLNHRETERLSNGTHQIKEDHSSESLSPRSVEEIHTCDLSNNNEMIDLTVGQHSPNTESSHQNQDIAVRDHVKIPRNFTELDSSRLPFPNDSLELASISSHGNIRSDWHSYRVIDEDNLQNQFHIQAQFLPTLSATSREASQHQLKRYSKRSQFQDVQALSEELKDPTGDTVDDQANRCDDRALPNVTSPALCEFNVGLNTDKNDTQKVKYSGLNENATVHINDKNLPTAYINATNISDGDAGISSNKDYSYSDNDNLYFPIERHDGNQFPSEYSLRYQGRINARVENVNGCWLFREYLVETAGKSSSCQMGLVGNDEPFPNVDLGLVERKSDKLDKSDSDLEAMLLSQWELDRSKKAIRKKEREELRLSGMLGRKKKIKYKEKRSFTKLGLNKEIQLFLSSTDESQSFPPLERSERKFVHELAHALGLKSRSIGKGNLRHPVLYKTTASVKQIDGESSLDPKILRQIHRCHRRREHVNLKNNKIGNRGDSDRVAVGYREGDIVGAAAPELAAENVGNQLMRKLGWVPGEGLGAQNNKGILQPVAHVVKTSRAGLG